MAKLTVDFSQVETFEALPPGEYPVVIESVEVRQSETGEFPYLNFTLVIPDGEYANRKLWFIGSLSPKALWRLQATFASFGLEGDEHELDVDDGTGVLLNPQLVGLPAIARVSNELYQGRMTSRVNDLIGAEGAAAESTPSEAPAEGEAEAPARKSPFAPRAAAASTGTNKPRSFR